MDGGVRPGHLIVCEGIPDALIAAQEGWRSVAVLGSQTPDAALTARLAARADQDQLTIHAICDNDDASRTWGTRLADLLDDHDHAPIITKPPTPGADLTDWALEDPTWSSQINGIALDTRDDALQAPQRSPTVGQLAHGMGVETDL